METCQTCDGAGIVSVPWPSGYPHAIPCPECRPGAKCCDVKGCPAAKAIAAWSESRTKEQGQ